MPIYAQLVIGPAGSGKSYYCNIMQQHMALVGRTARLVNLDPAAEFFAYEPDVDIRELISIEDVMEDEELRLGPNGGLVFCLEHLTENFDWLHEQLQPQEDDYIIFDCPGQIELYTHLDVMKVIIEKLKSWDITVGGVFLMDSQFLVERGKFLSGVMAALSCMVKLEVPHINIMTKVDILSQAAKESLEDYTNPANYERVQKKSPYGNRYSKLIDSLFKVIEDYSLVNFYPLDSGDNESIGYTLAMVDNMIQWGEDQDVKTKDTDERDDFETQMQDMGLNRD